MEKGGTQLQHEYEVYKELKGGPGIPVVIHFGTLNGLPKDYGDNVLILELLGKDLRNLFKSCKNKFTLKTVLMFADQMIKTIEFIHSKA